MSAEALIQLQLQQQQLQMKQQNNKIQQIREKDKRYSEEVKALTSLIQNDVDNGLILGL